MTTVLEIIVQSSNSCSYLLIVQMKFPAYIINGTIIVVVVACYLCI